MKHLAVFASGTGSNFIEIHQNVINKIIPAKLVCFVSDQEKAPSVSYALKNNIPSFVFNIDHYSNRKTYETALLNFLKTYEVDLIVLAGYMRIIGPTLLNAYPNKIINIHPSLLPLYKGKDAIKRAWDAKEDKTGVTIHYVDAKIDNGKIIMQKELPIQYATLDELIKAIHGIEHEMYTQAINLILEELK